MIKLDPHPTSLTYDTNLKGDLKTDHRLIVLVPADIDYSAATQRIWKLAKATNMHVQLLGLSKDAARALELRRGLVTMASLLQDGKICAEVKLEIGTNWINVVAANYATSDVIVCFTEQHTGPLHRPLSQIMESTFKATVYVLSNLTLQETPSNTLSQVSAWLGFIVIIISFGLLQANIVQLPKGWLQNILLILSLIPEFWLIWVWHFRSG